MRLRPTPRIAPVALSVAVTFLTVCGAGAAAASPTPATAPPVAGSIDWAYGTVTTLHGHHQGLLFSWDATATFGFAVVLGETVGTGGAYTVYVNRTMGLLLSAQYCRPNCAHALGSGTVNVHVWETTLATLGMTSEAYVTVGSTAVPALGVTSSSVQVAVGLNEGSRSYNLSIPTGALNLSAYLNGTSSTSFSPPLGLMPLQLADESWTNSSTFSETGSASWKTSEIATGLLGSVSTKHHGSVPLDRNGSVTVNGSFNGTTVPLAGSTYDALDLSVAGPFTLRDGFLLIPTASDLFGPTAPTWLSSNTTGTAGSAVVSSSRLDVSNTLATGAHLGLSASALSLATETKNPAAVTVLGSGPSLVAGPATPVPAAGPGANATYIQGSPESVGQATTDQQCLSTGIGCPVGAPHRLPFGLIAVGGAVVVGVLLVALVAERRRMPAAPYPNAKLYPPGGAALASAPTEIRRPTGAPPADEDDPLGHLW